MRALVFTVYCHTCIVTGKKYVGQTKKTMETRWREHVSDAGRGGGCLALGRAIRKHGHDCWTHEVLETVASQAEIDAAETKWISQLNTIAPHGYNLDTGGIAPRHPNVREKIRKTRAAKPIEWQKTQTALLREAHVVWLASSSSEERREKALEAWRRISPEERGEIARKREAAMDPEARRARARRGKTGMTPETRRAAALKGAASRTYEARCESARKGAATITPQKRSEIARAGQAALLAAYTPAQRSEWSRLAAASRTPEQRQAIGRAAYAVVGAKWAAMTHKQRSANAHKAWATKRAKAAALDV